MARGISIKDVENKIQNINDNNVLPISTGADVPEVVTVGVLKEHINEDIDTALEGKQDVINDLATIRSGAALGATAVQEESDPTVPSWAKQSSKPSYSYSEITGKPTLSAVATSGSYNDLTNKPDIPSEQIQSDWNQSNTSAKDFIKNKPTIPTVPTNVSAFTNDAGYITGYTETDPTVPSWAKASTKPSYTASEVGALPDTTVVPTESTVSGWGFTKNAGTITGITMNGASKGTSGVVDLGTVITAHQSLTDYVQKSNTSGLLKNDGTVDTSTYLTSAPVTSVNGQTGAVSLTIPTVPSNVSAFTNDAGYTTNTGTVTSIGSTVTVNNIQVLSALPQYPDANTLYLITGS